MSTKIYTGFKFKTNNFFEIFNELKAIRAQCIPLLEGRMNKLMAERSVTLLDRYCYYKEKFPKPTAPIVDTWLEIMERVKKVKQTSQRDPEVDFSFQICIIPYNNEFFGIYYTEQKDFKVVLESSKLFQDFSYWDNSDPLDSVSDEEWAVRGTTWDNIFKEEGIPQFISTSYDVIDMVNDMPHPTAEKVLENIPSMKVRLKSLVTDLLFQDRVRCKQIQLTSENAFKEYREYLDWSKTEDGIKAFEMWEENVTKHLILSVTVKDLVGER
jgi:hypothetical protein